MIKRIALLLSLVLLAGFAVGCSSGGPEVNGAAFHVESDSGLVINMTEGRVSAEKTLGQRLLTMEYEDDVEQVQYVEHGPLFTRFYQDTIVALWIDQEDSLEYGEIWHAVVPLADRFEQVSFGTSRADLEALFQPDQYQSIVSSAGEDFAFIVAYDANFRPQAYSTQAPYATEFRFEGGRLTEVVFWDNLTAPDMNMLAYYQEAADMLEGLDA